MIRVANILVVRVSDWLASGRELSPWKVERNFCDVCGEEVIVTPEYTAMVVEFGFAIRYVCTHCFPKETKTL